MTTPWKAWSHACVEQQADGGDTRAPSILHASAQVLISRRDEDDPGPTPRARRTGTAEGSSS